MSDIVADLRERSMQFQSTAWGRIDGGQECSLSAIEADAAADEIESLRSQIEALSRERDLANDRADGIEANGLSNCCREDGLEPCAPFDSLENELIATKASLAKAREALEPFASAWDRAMKFDKTATLAEFGALAGYHVGAVDFRRARGVLASLKGGADND